MNLQNYYTEPQAELVLFRSPKGYRKQTNAVKLFNRWWYERSATRQVALVANEKKEKRTAIIKTLETRDLKAMDLDADLYVNLSDAMTIWPYTRERLYQVSIRSDKPRVRYHSVFGRTIFLKQDLHSYINA